METTVQSYLLSFKKEDGDKLLDLLTFEFSNLNHMLMNKAKAFTNFLHQPKIDELETIEDSLKDAKEISLDLAYYGSVMDKIRDYVQGKTHVIQSFSLEEVAALLLILKKQINLHNSFIAEYTDIYAQYLSDTNYQSDKVTMKQAYNCLVRSQEELAKYNNLFAELIRQLTPQTQDSLKYFKEDFPNE